LLNEPIEVPKDPVFILFQKCVGTQKRVIPKTFLLIKMGFFVTNFWVDHSLRLNTHFRHQSKKENLLTRHSNEK
jgi:hypothetical protein